MNLENRITAVHFPSNGATNQSRICKDRWEQEQVDAFMGWDCFVLVKYQITRKSSPSRSFPKVWTIEQETLAVASVTN